MDTKVIGMITCVACTGSDKLKNIHIITIHSVFSLNILPNSYTYTLYMLQC